MKDLILVFFLLCNPSAPDFLPSNTEKQTFLLEGTQEEIMNFVPEGYSITDTSSGDLNLDCHPDLIMILTCHDERVAEDCMLRPMLIYLGTEENQLKLAERNDRAVLCTQCGGMMGDPFAGLSIKCGTFTIEHNSGTASRWATQTTFRYSPDDSQWYLHSEREDSFHIFDENQGSTTLRTEEDFGLISFGSYNAY